MDLSQAENLAHNLLRRHDLSSWNFQFDRAKKRFGLCNYTTQTISLSKHLTELNPQEIVQDTILHEIAHALCGPKTGHGKAWKTKVVEIGGTAKRCFSPTDINTLPLKYTASCPHCGHSFQAARKRKIACGDCCKKHNNGKYTSRFEIIFEENKGHKKPIKFKKRAVS